jgi:hypothetical protein
VVVKHTGEVALRVGARDCTVVYDWHALARLQSELGEDALQQLRMGMDLRVLSVFLAAGLAARHPEMTPDAIMADPPALIPAITAAQTALSLVLWGPDGPPKEKPKAGKNPPKREATGSPTPSAPIAAPASSPSDSGT